MPSQLQSTKSEALQLTTRRRRAQASEDLLVRHHSRADDRPAETSALSLVGNDAGRSLTAPAVIVTTVWYYEKESPKISLDHLNTALNVVERC